MANGGYKDVYVTAYDTLRFTWEQIEQSISGNYTKIKWYITLSSTSSGAISSTASKSWNTTVNGAYYEGKNTVGIGNNTVKTLASGETIIHHDAEGTKEFSYSFSQYFGITFSGAKINTISGSGKGVLNPIPRKATFKTNGVSSFDDTKGPTIYFNHPAGSALDNLQACIKYGESFIAGWQKIDVTKNSYTFDISTIREKIWQQTINAGSDTIDVTFGLATWIGSKFEYSYSTTVKCTVTDCVPELSPTVVDTGTVSSELTGDNDSIIRYYNYIVATFNAVAKKGASIISKKVTCGNHSRIAEGDYAVFEGVDSGDFIFTIKDNRGHEVSTPISKTVVEYDKLTCRTVIDKNLSNDNELDIGLTIKGKYFDGSFGAKNNSLAVEYRYKTSTTNYPETWTPIDVSSINIADGEYTAIATISDLNYQEIYTIQTRAKDEVYTGYISAKDEVVKVIPVFDWGENDFNFNVPVTIQGKNIYPAGSTERIARAYTQETDISYEANSYIKLFRSNSPTDLYNKNIATFNDNGTITINKDMLALINIHIVSSNPGGRSWIRLMNYDVNWKYTDCINYGSFTASQLTIVLPLSKNTIIGVTTVESMVINASGLVGSYIEIIEL